MLQRRVDKIALAYITGAALGDGNLSNPNGRATRLRITCDNKYPKIIKVIKINLSKIMPKNKVAEIKKKKNCCDISCYSNQWEKLLGWKAKSGSKIKQNIGIPKWIFQNKSTRIACLRGLLDTDGSYYFDRGYLMINFVTMIPKLAKHTFELIKITGYQPKIYHLKIKNQIRHNIRISKNTKNFVKLIKPNK